MYSNGFIVQEFHSPTNYVDSFIYKGIEAYHQWPLLSRYDKTAQELSRKVLWKSLPNGLSEYKEFITERDVLFEYLCECELRQIAVRILFLESDYADEKCVLPDNNLNFIGFEYCSIPIDNIIITDFDMHSNTLFKEYKKNLNEYGLFNSYQDALSFKMRYDELMKSGVVGDGGIDAYIFKVSEL
ncbi:MAG: hypothetical protein IJN86_05185 [Clostridia bacterium]|nr:hypothetical protein [Clostridia bacterium]